MRLDHTRIAIRERSFLDILDISLKVTFAYLGDVYPGAGASLGFVVSLVGFMGILLGVVAGLLVSRIGFRRALVGGLALGAVLSLAQSTFPNLPLLLATRVVEGLSHLAIVVAAPTLIAQLSAPRHSGFTLTLWGSFFGVAFAVLAWAGLPAVERLGLSALFVAHGLYMAVFAVILSLRLPRDEIPDEPERLTLPAIGARHLAIYRSPFISAPAIAWLFYTFSFVSLLTLLPPYIDPAWRAAVIGAMPLVSIASSLTIGVALLRLVGAVRVIETGFALSAVSACALIAFPGNPVICIALAAALGLVQGAGFAAVPQLNAAMENRALANGAMAQTGNIGNTIGTPILLAAGLWAGHTGMMTLAAVMLLTGIALQMVLAGRRAATI